MDRQLLRWELIGVIFVFVLGTLLHFVFNWSNKSRVIGLIAPVNESVWEHLKLVLFPALLYSIIEYGFSEHFTANFWTAKTIGIYAAIASIITIFYIYTSILGRNLLILDILTFLLSVVIGQLISYCIMVSNQLPVVFQKLSVPLMAVLLFAFFLFTFYPPHLPFFKNPLDGTYGI